MVRGARINACPGETPSELEAAQRNLVRVIITGSFKLHTVIPRAVHFIRRGNPEGTHDAEADKVSVDHVPGALGKTWILLLPLWL